MTAQEYINTKDVTDGELWTLSNESLAEAMEEYTSIKLSEIVKELEDQKDMYEAEYHLGLNLAIESVKEAMK
jgi:hypothetical protein